MKPVRITAVWKVCDHDLMAKYENPIEHAGDDGFRPVSFDIEVIREET